MGCITSTKIKDVCLKVDKTGRSRGKIVQVTPPLVRLFKESNLESVSSITYERENKKEARNTFAENVVKKHQNGRLLDCSLLASKTFPFIRATPDNIFTCKCCDDVKVLIEYKCPYKLREKQVSESYRELDFLEGTNGRIHLRKRHKY